MAQATGCLGSQEQEVFLMFGRVSFKLLDFSNRIGIEALLSYGHRQSVAGATRDQRDSIRQLYSGTETVYQKPSGCH